MRNDTLANWASENPTLLIGEVGIETDTKRIKIGDGATAWNSLSWEQRRELSTEELIKAMGPLHAHHPDFKAKPRTLLPVPNLTGVNGAVIEGYNCGLTAQIKQIFKWALR